METALEGTFNLYAGELGCYLASGATYLAHSTCNPTQVFLCISFLYRWALTVEQQLTFELLVRWCKGMYAGEEQEVARATTLTSGLPLTFLLGFYVALVVKRWWEQYCRVSTCSRMGNKSRKSSANSRSSRSSRSRSRITTIHHSSFPGLILWPCTSEVWCWGRGRSQGWSGGLLSGRACSCSSCSTSLHPQVLPPLLRPLYPETVCQAQEEIS